ncbi:hypothetical protein DSUL_20300 [Desulfovibrionales bacterium]
MRLVCIGCAQEKYSFLFADEVLVGVI